MSLGISDFRALVTAKGALENRRVSVEDNPLGQQAIRAPSSLWGRVVDWLTDGAVGPNVGRENQEARQTFYDALVKSNGKDFADRILHDTVGMDGDTFVQSTATLRASTIKRVIDAADTQREAFIVRTHHDAMAFTQTQLADAARESQAGQANPGLRFDDPELGRVFWNMVRFDPGFGRKLFTKQDVEAIVERAVTQYVEKREAQFTEQFPGLAGLENDHLRDKESYFDQLHADLGRPPLSSLGKVGHGVYADWMRQALGAVQDFQGQIAGMDFKPEDAGRLKAGLQRQLGDMEELARQGYAVEGRGAANIANHKVFLEKVLAEQVGRRTLIDDILPGCARLGLQPSDRKALGETCAAVFESTLNKILRNGGSLGDQDSQELLRQRLSDALHGELGKLGVGEDDRNQLIGTALDRLQERIEAGADSLKVPQETLDSARKLQGALLNDLDRQISLARAKIEFIDEFIQNDPLSDKNVAYNKLVWTQASALALKDAADDLREKLAAAQQHGNRPLAEKLANHLADVLDKQAEAHVRVQNAREEWQQAGTGRSVSPREKDYSDTHPLKQHRKDEEKFLKDAFEHAKLIPEGGASAYLAKRQVKALDTIQDWHTIERKMFVQRDGVARTYTSEIKPGSQIGHGVGDAYTQDGLKGVSAGNKTEAGHGRNLQISALYRDEIGPGGEQLGRVKVSQTIRHGVLDAWKIEDPIERRDASRAGAKEVLTTAMVSDEQFLARAKANSLANIQDGDHPVSKLVHINLNLTTADSLLVRKASPDYREYDFTRNQFDAFDSHTGHNTLTADGQNVNLDVDTITLSFGVNAVALGEGAPWALALESSRWPEDIVEHNRQNLEKLVGDLGWGSAPGGYVGGIVDQLRDKAADPNTSADDVEQINATISKIQRETDRVRRMFNDGEYKNGIEDAYKMDRHIMSLVNTTQDALANLLDNHDMMMTLSQGCKSNKDRGGMGDVEHKAQVIIEDMGGQVNPSEEFSEQDQIIYNTVLTSSGQAEVQQLNTGLPGSKNAGEVKARINDPDAVTYARGFADFTKA